MAELVRYKMYVNGDWVDATKKRAIESINPYTNRAWATVPEASVEDVERAVESARRAFDAGEWRRLNGYQRATLMFRLADLLDARAEQIGRIESTDNGKVIRETINQARFAARVYRYFAGLADKLTGDLIPLDNSDMLDYVVREPVGVCALIIAWNSPIQLLANKLAPALAAGNTVVVKPSEFASASILEFARLVHEAGFPPGVFNVVTGYGQVVGQTLCQHPAVDLVSLTGGVQTGRAVGSMAASNLKKLALELGGKSPQIVFDDADLRRAVPGVVAGIFAAAGQTCIAGSRLLVQRSIYDQFMGKLVEMATKVRLGDPLDPETEMGPLANRPQFERVMSYIRYGLEEGATLACGGRRAQGSNLDQGLFVEPTIFVDANNRMRIAREEIFGPVLTVLPFENEQEAIELANDSEFGLAAGVWTSDIGRALRVAKAVQSGTVWVNTYRAVSAAAPFGGYKTSGIGRERGIEALRTYTQVKNVMIDFSSGAADPFAIRT